MSSQTALTPSVSGIEKAAIFLMGIGDPLSAELLRLMEPAEIRRVTAAISALDSIKPAPMLTVFREFESLTATSRFYAKGGQECARRLLEQALGPIEAQKVLEQPSTEADDGAEASVFQNVEPQQLATFLRDENPQTIALVLSNIPQQQAGALMSALPPAIQPVVALRMASLDRLSPEVFQRISEVIGTKLKALRQMSRSDGVKSLAGLLNYVDQGTADTILAGLDAENQTISSAVRDQMFIFDDFLSINKESMTVLIAKADKKVITIALKGTSGQLRDHFTQCMSQRATEMLLEDMEALGPIRIRDVKQSQQQLVALVRQLQQSGDVTVPRDGGEDEYVV